MERLALELSGVCMPSFSSRLFAEMFRKTWLTGKKRSFFFSGSFFGNAAQQVNLSSFVLRSRDRDNPSSLLLAPDKVT